MPKSTQSTVYVDNRVGSVELAPSLDFLLRPNSSKVTRLKYGDFCFMAPQGSPEDGPASIGIERKRIRDMVNSVMSGRLSGSQLPGMAEHYDFIVLIVEGVYRCNATTGRLEVKTQHGSWSDKIWSTKSLDYRALDAALNTLRFKTPIQVIKTPSPQHTALEIFHLWHWFTSKKWSRHSSHIRFPHIPNQTALNVPGKASTFRRMVKELPNIGWERSQEVEDFFDGDFTKLAKAGVKEWCLLNGITEQRAMEILKALKNRV